jgi:hypothetical protein
MKSRITLSLAVILILLTVPVAAKAEPAEGCGLKIKDSFAKRFYKTYKEHLNWTGENVPPLEHNEDAVDAPLSSPPFPSATWNIGGTTPLGYADNTVAPMMDALYCGENGKSIKDSRTKLYGWLDPGMNISSSESHFNTTTGTGGNYPAAYYPYPNQLTLNQAALYLERVPDTVQRDHIDYGFRLTGMYGTDYKYTFSNKLLSNQYLKDHKKYGFDPVMFYGDLYVPQVAKGMNIRVGRYISIPDIEAQLAPNNYTYSHSLLYSFDPYTHEGVVTTVKLNKNWTVQGELSVGADVTVFDKRNRKLTPGACVSWTSDSGNDNIYPCINGINSGKYAYNNMQMLAATWYHKFDSKWHMATEAYYMWERQVPNANNPDAPPTILGTNAAQCAPGNLTCRASVNSAVNYLVYKFTPKDFITLRNEFFKDSHGQRTGYKTLYTEHLIGWTHWFGDVITLRPELRFDHSYDAKAYDGGRESSQYVFATDLIVHF